MALRVHLVNWLLFVALCFIWGSSFILMKVGLNSLSAWQVAALRILSAGIFLMPVAIKNLAAVPKNKLPQIILSGLLGSFFPAFLFCIAETKIDSAFTGILNAFTPVFTILIGAFFFNTKIEWKKMVGICISFAGLLLLMLNKGAISNDEISYSALVILATVFYAANINMVSRHLQGVGSMNIAATAFTFLCLPSAIILIYTGFFQFNFRSVPVIISTGASAILGIFGTAIASVLFYMLVKRAGVLFASLITYGIPFVALFWGVIYGEPITLMQVACLSVILAGIFVSNR